MIGNIIGCDKCGKYVDNPEEEAFHCMEGSNNEHRNGYVYVLNVVKNKSNNQHIQQVRSLL